MFDLEHLRSHVRLLIQILKKPLFGRDIATKTRIAEQAEDLHKALERSEIDETYRVAVVGSFKVGKSSFVNAICEVPRLASVDANPETAAITTFRYAENARAEVRMIRRAEWESIRAAYRADPDDIHGDRYRKLVELERDPQSNVDVGRLEADLISEQGVTCSLKCDYWAHRSPERQEFFDELRKYTSRRDPRHYFVDCVRVLAPVPFLEGGVELIDTPGLNDTDRYRVSITEEYIRDVDAILFLTRSGASYSQSDKDFLMRQLRRKTLGALRIVVTKCDETYESACRDAEEREEEPPTFRRHIAVEESRLRGELRRTLEELLRGADVKGSEGEYFHRQLDDVAIDFTSAHDHRDPEQRHRSGIDQLHDDLMVMLRRAERVEAARSALTLCLSRAVGRVRSLLVARREAIFTDTTPDQVRVRLNRVSSHIEERLKVSEGEIATITATLRAAARHEVSLAEHRIENLMLLCDTVIAECAEVDTGRGWQTRRSGRWGSLGELQSRVAQRIFPTVEQLLQADAKRFAEALGRIARTVRKFEARLRNVDPTHDGFSPLSSLDLSGQARQTMANAEREVASQIELRQTVIVRGLDRFIRDEAAASMEAARERVTGIRGKGTQNAQTVEVVDFYDQLKNAVRSELGTHVRGQMNEFREYMACRAEAIYPEIREDLNLILQDRINAVQTGHVATGVNLVAELDVALAECDRLQVESRGDVVVNLPELVGV